jgi:hypothetical protein
LTPDTFAFFVEGNKITFTWPGADKPLEIRAVPGQYRVEVKKDGFKTFGKVVTVETDGSEEITVRLEPAVVARPGGKGSISRTITDIMIVIKPINDVAAHYKDRFPMQVDRNIKATLRDNKTYISEAYGRKDVFCTHPFSHSSPGIIDFSRITKDRTGSSILWVHGYPGHLGQRIVVKSEDVIINDATVHFADGWKPIEVQFRRSQVRVYP